MHGATYWRIQQAEWEAKHPFNAKLDKIVPSVVGAAIALVAAVSTIVYIFGAVTA